MEGFSAKASVCSSVSQGQERNPMPRVGLVGFCTSDGHLDESLLFQEPNMFPTLSPDGSGWIQTASRWGDHELRG